ncbi:MAG: hypothetical protein ACRDK4_15395 [Solirubrobacteraceae bacterium]
MLEGFLRAYHDVPSGIPHRLTVILNGFHGSHAGALEDVRRLLVGVDHQVLLPPAPVADLVAYRMAALKLQAERICFLNSYSRPLAPHWLAMMDAAFGDPGVGMVGASGSFESAFSAAPRWLRPLRRRDFAPFPNPHLRSNAFLLDRELMLGLAWEVSRSKASAWALESGRGSISNQIWERGMKVLIVGRDGVAYPPERWQESATFRSGEQRNLLVADNRTEQYATADPKFKRRLERMAWGV